MSGAAAALALSASTRPRYSFRGKHVLITGGARGLGLVLARQLADEGASLYIVSRTAHQLERAEQLLRARGATVSAWVCDLRDPEAVAAAVTRVVGEAGRIDGLINNAGVINASPLEHVTVEDYEESLQVHFWAPLFAMRAALPYMRRQQAGRILNVSSIGGRVSVPHLNAYGAGKAALLALSDGVRAEVAKDGIVVTTATPGLMRTGSHVNVGVRGQHAREAQLFAAGVATPLTSMDAERAARQMLDAVRRGRAQVTPGWQARALARLNTLAPELTADLMAAAASWLLPGPAATPAGDERRRSRDIGFGAIAPFLPRAAVTANNER